jgi:hypothetical protein
VLCRQCRAVEAQGAPPLEDSVDENDVLDNAFDVPASLASGAKRSSCVLARVVVAIGRESLAACSSEHPNERRSSSATCAGA